MRKKLIVLFILLSAVTLSIFISCGSTEAAGSLSGPKRIVGYYMSWAIYARDFQIHDIPAEKMTHINYAFANISKGGKIAVGDSWADKEKEWYEKDFGSYSGNFKGLIALKEKYPHLKTLIAVGGWTWSANFSDIALTKESRKIFAQSCIDFIRRYKFNGVDLDWEYPGGGGLEGNTVRPEDPKNFTKLLAELRKQLDAAAEEDGKQYLLTIAASAGLKVINTMETYKIHKYLDWINVMTYDYAGSWNDTTNHLSPLYMNPDDPSDDEAPEFDKSSRNTSSSLQAYLDAGVPPYKLVAGIPFYGKAWQLASTENNGLYQESAGIPMGTWDAVAGEPASGTLEYWDIQENYIPNYENFWDDSAEAAYLLNEEEKMFISFDSIQSVNNKCNYILQNELGGVMFWSISADKNEELIDVIYSKLDGQ